MSEDERHFEWWEEYGQHLEDNHYELSKASWHAALESRWQSIETLPPEDIEVDIWSPKYGRITDVKYVASENAFVPVVGEWIKYSREIVTHFMPPPSPPNERR